VEETDAPPGTDQPSEFVEDEDVEAIRKRYHDDVGNGKQIEVEESWREIKWTWGQLPGMYLQLSKSRLTGEF